MFLFASSRIFSLARCDIGTHVASSVGASSRHIATREANSWAIVDKTMIEELNFDGQKTSVILDNYILGLLTVKK